MVEPFDVAQILLINDIGPGALFFGLSLIGGLLPENVSVRYDYQELKKFCWAFSGFCVVFRSLGTCSDVSSWALIFLSPPLVALVFKFFGWPTRLALILLERSSVGSLGSWGTISSFGSSGSLRHCRRGCCNRSAMWICCDGWSTLVVFWSTRARCNDHPCWSTRVNIPVVITS